MCPVLLMLNPDHNPVFKELWDRSIKLKEEWLILNQRVLRFPRRLIWIKGPPASLLTLGHELKQYEKQCVEWSQDVGQFLLNPDFEIEGQGVSAQTTFLHYTAELREMRRDMTVGLELLRSNYNHVCEHFFNQRNLVLSWLAVILSMLGIAISLLPILISCAR